VSVEGKEENQVPLVDLRAQYQSIREEIDAAIRGVLNRARFIGGEPVRRFEERFAAFCEAKSAVGVGNGTDALFLALKALGVGRGDEVVVPAFTFIATSEAVTATGARPLFADVQRDTGNLDPEAFRSAITPRTKAVIPVHLYGRPANMSSILDIADRHGIAVVEDAAQAHGARDDGRRVGSIGTLACFSFYPGKNLGAYGDAGAVVTNDDALAKKARILRDHGRTEKYVHRIEGYNSRLDTLQAAILNVKLGHLEEWNRRREQVAARYRDLLSDVEGVRMLAPAAEKEHVYHLFVVCVKNRDEVLRRLADRGISAGVHYPLPLHLQPAYRSFGHKAGEFPVAEELASEVLSLPMYPELTEVQQDYVVQELRMLIDQRV